MEILFRTRCTSITPSKTYLARVRDENRTHCLGTYPTEEEAYTATYKFREERLVRVCKKYGHRIEDGVIVDQYYLLFNNGDIFATDTAHKLKPNINKGGYLFVQLNGHIRKIHRLIAENFIPNPLNKPCVNHKDGIKTNNNISNLEWCTQSENVKHAYDTGLKIPHSLKGEVCPWSVLSSDDVEYIRKHYIPRDKNFSQYALAKKFGVTQQLISKIILNERWVGEDEVRENMAAIKYDRSTTFLRDYQLDAVKRMRTGCILNGGVGSGKSRTSIFYYFKENGGWLDRDKVIPMKNPKDLIIISTSQKRDLGEWNEELVPFLLYPDKKTRKTHYGNKVFIDSWNNIKKYDDIKNAFFIFDEDRVTGSGAWVKSFLKIAKCNDWIILSASPGDMWQDYEAVFIANGFFRNRTEFRNEHFVYSRYAKFPQVIAYRNEIRLIRLRDSILVDMDFDRKTVPHHENIDCTYDKMKYRDVMRNRWNPYKNEPIQQAAGLCYVLRRIVNEDDSRQVALLELMEKHPKAIIFYNFDYELAILKNLAYPDGTNIAEYNGHVHQPLPTGDKWVYLVNYTAGNAGWNCIKTDTIIFYSQNYSYKVMLQSAGRIDRLNTPYTDLYYYHLKSRSGIDLAISKALAQKKKFNENRWCKW